MFIIKVGNIETEREINVLTLLFRLRCKQSIHGMSSIRQFHDADASHLLIQISLLFFLKKKRQ